MKGNSIFYYSSCICKNDAWLSIMKWTPTFLPVYTFPFTFDLWPMLLLLLFVIHQNANVYVFDLELLLLLFYNCPIIFNELVWMLLLAVLNKKQLFIFSLFTSHGLNIYFLYLFNCFRMDVGVCLDVLVLVSLLIGLTSGHIVMMIHRCNNSMA